jgi:hypothetical protein
MSNRRPDASYNLCNFRFANGNHCTMPAHPEHNGLCLSHATIHRRTFHREDYLLRELASPAGDSITQIDIKHVLGKLFDALASNRVSPRRASTLAYIAHLLIQSQKGAKREATQWEIDANIFRRLAEIKYPAAKKSKATSSQPKLTSETTAADLPAAPKSPPKS